MTSGTCKHLKYLKSDRWANLTCLHNVKDRLDIPFHIHISSKTTITSIDKIDIYSKDIQRFGNIYHANIFVLQEAASIVEMKNWPTLLDTDDLPKRRLAVVYRAPTPEMICYLDFSVSTTGMLAGIKVLTCGHSG